MLQTVRKTGSVLTTALAGFGCYLALAGFVSAARGNTNDLSLGQAFTLSAIVLVGSALVAFGAWRLWPRRNPSGTTSPRG
jgi:uncharacterized membrane protein YdfJ with MMPL/SSD domain